MPMSIKERAHIRSVFEKVKDKPTEANIQKFMDLLKIEQHRKDLMELKKKE